MPTYKTKRQPNPIVPPALRTYTEKPVFGLVVGVPEPSVDMGTFNSSASPSHSQCVILYVGWCI